MIQRITWIDIKTTINEDKNDGKKPCIAFTVGESYCVFDHEGMKIERFVTTQYESDDGYDDFIDIPQGVIIHRENLEVK